MMRLTQKIHPFIVGLLIFSYSHLGSSQTVEKQAILAVLTFNIASFTTWPTPSLAQSQSPLNLCVYGNNVVHQSFAHIDGKAIHHKNIHIINLSKLHHLERCQVLYLSTLQRRQLIPLLTEIQSQPILTIGEGIDFLRAGGIVGLEHHQGKIQLNINLPKMKLSGLMLSSRLLNIANIVTPPSFGIH